MIELRDKLNKKNISLMFKTSFPLLGIIICKKTKEKRTKKTFKKTKSK